MAGGAAPTPREAAEGAELVFMCVGNDDDIRSVAYGEDGALAGLGQGCVLVDHTTASADIARELEAEAKSQGKQFLDAPVSGGQAGAENGVLTIMCGGEQAAFERAKPVMEAYGRAVTLMGPAGAGQLTKMVNQLCIAGLVQGLAEAINFGMRAGLDMEQVIAVISKGAAQSWQMDNRAKTMVAGQVRLRLPGRVDAQGPQDLHGGGQPQRRAAAGHGADRPVLPPGDQGRRQALGHLQPDPQSAAAGLGTRGHCAGARRCTDNEERWPAAIPVRGCAGSSRHIAGSCASSRPIRSPTTTPASWHAARQSSATRSSKDGSASCRDR